MKDREKEKARRVLILLKYDANHLRTRIVERIPEAMHIFSNKRTREHFKDIFFSRYKDIGFGELALCSEEIISAVDDFYDLVEKFEWYLTWTQEMPNTIRETADRFVFDVTRLHDTLELYLSAEISGHKDDQESFQNEALDHPFGTDVEMSSEKKPTDTPINFDLDDASSDPDFSEPV